jgi:subtilase family serine protease
MPRAARRGPRGGNMRFTRPLRLIPAFLAALLVAVLAPTVAASAAVPVCADLQVGTFTVNPPSPIAGQQATVTVHVTNNGTCTAFGATVQWKLTPSAASGPSAQITSLGAGQSTDVVLPFTFTKAGNFESIAQADTKNVVPETNEKNNIQILPVTVQPATRDLLISGISTTPSHPVQGRDAVIHVAVQNTGNSSVGPFRLRVVPKQFAAAIVQQIASQPAASTVTYDFHYTYQQAGNVTIKATVDTTNSVKESNERNNNASQAVTVDPPKPDLTIDNVVVSVGVPGTESDAAITVHNIGNSTAAQNMLSWQPGPGLGPVSTQIDPLGVNATAVYHLKYVFASPGHFNGTATVDSTDVVSEINEDNNTFGTSVDVSPNTVDLVIVSESITPSPQQGKPSTVDIKVKNLGNTASGQFLVDWNPDANYVISPSPQTVTYEVGPLGPGATTDVTFSYTYPAFGNFSTLATLDPRNQVQETNEANNQLIKPVTVSPGDVDLQVTACSASPTSIKRFSSSTASITVKNFGTFPSSGTTVKWLPTGSGTSGPSASIPPLSPGETKTVQLKATFWNLGDFTGKATVDPNNTVVEPSHEGNNSMTCNKVTVTKLS